MNYCCDNFKRWVQSAGVRGFSAVAQSDCGYRFFCLQARGCDKQDEPKMKNIPKGLDIPNPLTIAMQVGIQYCPFCGTQLATFIAEAGDEFQVLADANRPLLIDP